MSRPTPLLKVVSRKFRPSCLVEDSMHIYHSIWNYWFANFESKKARWKWLTCDADRQVAVVANPSVSSHSNFAASSNISKML